MRSLHSVFKVSSSSFSYVFLLPPAVVKMASDRTMHDEAHAITVGVFIVASRVANEAGSYDKRSNK